MKRQSSPTPRENVPTRSSKYVCVKHRTVDKPCCDAEKDILNYRWRAPKKRNDRAWRRIERGQWLWEHDPKDARDPTWLTWAYRLSNPKHAKTHLENEDT